MLKIPMHLLCKCGHEEPLYWQESEALEAAKKFTCPKCGRTDQATLCVGEGKKEPEEPQQVVLVKIVENKNGNVK